VSPSSNDPHCSLTPTLVVVLDTPLRLPPRMKAAEGQGLSQINENDQRHTCERIIVTKTEFLCISL
jgi:hypothetical protein